jgi:site-specific DNA-methyltransferase (adenine-specific)
VDVDHARLIRQPRFRIAVDGFEGSEEYWNDLLTPSDSFCSEVFRKRTTVLVQTREQFTNLHDAYKSNISRDGRRVASDGDAAWLKPAFAEIFRVLRHDSFCVSFYGWHQADKFIAAWREAGFRLAGHLTFPKQYASTERFLQYRHENAYLLAKGSPDPPMQRIPDVLEWKYSGNRLHPTQKPLCVLTPLIRSFSRPGDIVLDPFCGSGSTLLAAKLQGRSFIGIELDPAYYNIALDRLLAKAA